MRTKAISGTPAAVTLKPPAALGGMEDSPRGGYAAKKKGVYTASAALEASALQDLVDVLPDLVKAAAGVPLRFDLSVTLGDGQEVGKEAVEAMNKLLEEVNADLRLKA